jgi:N-acetylglucosamine-6-sulfatase
MMRTRIIILIAVLAVLPVFGIQQPAAATTPPNIIVFMIDDQPKGLWDAMPFTKRYLVDNGRHFVNGFIPTSLCCPSRSAFLTGDLAHTTGVYTNQNNVTGGYRAFRGYEDQTIAKALDGAGYNTALFGKYINNFNILNTDMSYVPPGWDEFVAFNPDLQKRDAAYYDYRFRGTTDNSVHYGSAPSDYSTDVLANKAVNYIRSTPTDQPMFMYFSPFSVHSPWTPAPKYRGTWPLEPRKAIPALNEADVSDKPTWVKRLPRVNVDNMRLNYTRQHEMSMSVDDAVQRITTAMLDTRDNTMFIYLADNGYMHGSHRIVTKDVPYDRSTNVPMAVRWDEGVTPGISPRVTTNVDLTAGIAEAAGIEWKKDGRSFLSTPRTGTLLEQIDNINHPSYCGWRTARYLYVRYDTDRGREFYDYQKDPEELVNRIGRDSYQKRIDRFRAITVKACSPVPPGFSWK